MATRKENFVFHLKKEIWHFCHSRKRFKNGMSVGIGPHSESLLHFINSERCMTGRSRNNTVFLPSTILTQPDDMPQKFHCLCTSLLTYREANSHFNLKFLVIFIETVKRRTNLVQKGGKYQIQPPDHNKSNKNNQGVLPNHHVTISNQYKSRCHPNQPFFMLNDQPLSLEKL